VASFSLLGFPSGKHFLQKLASDAFSTISIVILDITIPVRELHRAALLPKAL
jgi:hypothetical protein